MAPRKKSGVDAALDETMEAAMADNDSNAVQDYAADQSTAPATAAPAPAASSDSEHAPYISERTLAEMALGAETLKKYAQNG